MTYLSVRALRLYHEAGILVPVRVDSSTGYRYYDASQLPTAQVIRRLRDLDMPLDDIRAVVTASDVTSRNAALGTHLARMQEQLAATQATVASLQALLDHPAGPLRIEHRSAPRAQVAAIAAEVAMPDLDAWWADAFEELRATLQRIDARAAGPSGALYSTEFFEQEAGSVTAFLPVTDLRDVAGSTVRGRARALVIPAAELAVAVHQGSFSELDRTYAALGSYVAEREIGVNGPIREYYTVTAADTHDDARHRTEVCWPVFRTRPPSPATP